MKNKHGEGVSRMKARYGSIKVTEERTATLLPSLLGEFKLAAAVSADKRCEIRRELLSSFIILNEDELQRLLCSAMNTDLFVILDFTVWFYSSACSFSSLPFTPSL